MKNKLSHSQVRLHAECGRKYFLHYKERWRPKVIHGALLFGGSIDHALNVLLKDRNLEESITMFEKSWRYQNINDKGTYLPKSDCVVYSKRDFDEDLLLEEDLKSYYALRTELEYPSNGTIKDDYSFFIKRKEEVGFYNLDYKEKVLYNNLHWLCLRRKGIVMLTSYNKDILPKIKQVLAIQKTISLENNEGDIVTGYLDLIVEWENGKRYLLDNKTSFRSYDDDSAMQSQQLILYYHASKEEYKLDGVGFIVLYKNIDKNKTKMCAICKQDGTGKRHKTCDVEIEGKRCNGEWIVNVKPECFIDPILNSVTETAENLVIETFDLTNQAIKQGVFNPNLAACKQGELICPYFKVCWQGDYSEVMKLEKKKE